MANIANVTVFDGASTPVEHTLIPISVARENGATMAEWRENDAALPVNAQIKYKTKLSQLKSGIYKVDVELVIPVMETISGGTSAGFVAAPAVAHSVTGKVTMFFHERSTEEQRAHVRMILANTLRGTEATQSVGALGPVPALVDDLSAPT